MENKRFEKQTIDKRKDVVAEMGAKALKGTLGLLSVGAIIVKNKEKLKPLLEAAGKIIIK